MSTYQDGWSVDRKESTGTSSINRTGLDAVLGPKCFISGSVQLEGVSQIDGSVEGEIASSGELIIGESAAIKARITATRAKIYGRVVGDIDCSEKLELLSGAVVTGNISAPTLVIQDGVVFQGYCSMVQKTSLGLEVGRESSKSDSVIPATMLDTSAATATS